MSAEKLINRIQKDTEEQITKLLEDAKNQTRNILKEAKNRSQKEAEQMLRQAQEENENTKKILTSKAEQELRQDLMRIKEEIIEHCFSEALQKVTQLSDKQYQDVISHYLKQGKKRLGADCTVLVSRPLDREIAKKEGITVQGTIQASGGIILQSADKKISIDNTFEQILSRKKDELRIEVGKRLFSTL